jgi:hypothetical protein
MYTAEPIGNVREASVHELWNSERMRRLRDAHLKGDLREFPECRNCHAPNPRLPAILASFGVDTFKLRQWIPKAEKLAVFYRLPLFIDR